MATIWIDEYIYIYMKRQNHLYGWHIQNAMNTHMRWCRLFIALYRGTKILLYWMKRQQQQHRRRRWHAIRMRTLRYLFFTLVTFLLLHIHEMFHERHQWTTTTTKARRDAKRRVRMKQGSVWERERIHVKRRKTKNDQRNNELERKNWIQKKRT